MTKEKHQEYSQVHYYESFKKIRNKLRAYSVGGLVQRCIEYLHAPIADNLPYAHKQPWVVLLLIKWAIIDENAYQRGRPAPTKDQTHGLLQLTLDLGNKVRMPNQYEHYNLFFRALGYQQFIYQLDSSPVEIGRQFFYFSDLPEGHYLRATFKALTGLETTRFLELSQVLFLRFTQKNERSVSSTFFASLARDYSKSEIDAFLSAFSLTLDEMRKLLLVHETSTKSGNEYPRSPSEYYEQSSFLNFPLVKTGNDGYTCVEHHLMLRCIERYIYNRLRNYDANKFMTSFGPLFERYVELAVAHMRLKYVDESMIAKSVGKRKGVNLVDFVITEEDANIFVDAKAVEMSYQGKVAHELTEFTKWIQSSVLKAIIQGNSVLHAMAQFPERLPISPKPRNYLIAVTYSELYVGTGQTLMETLGAAGMKEIEARIHNGSAIPFENIYILTIREFEALAQAVHTKQVSLTKFLDAVTVADAHPHTRKFDLFQHLSALEVQSEPPSYLQARTLQEIERMAAKLKKFEAPTL